MSNANSVAGFAASGTLRNQFPTQTVATATETALLINTDTGTTTAFVTVPTGGLVYGATTGLDVNANSAVTDRSSYLYGLPSGESNDQFSSSSWDGRPFYVRLSGVGNAGANAAQSLIVNLYQGTSTTLGSDKIVGTTGAAFAAVAGGPFNFVVEATLLWDPTSGILSGSYESNIAFGTVAQYTTRTVVPNVVTGVTAAGLSFLASLKLGNAASSTITLREFVIERI
jgi:hypothetical protein